MKIIQFFFIYFLLSISIFAQSQTQSKDYYSTYLEMFNKKLNPSFSSENSRDVISQFNYDLDSAMLDAFIDSIMGRWEIPGMTTLIIKNGSPIFNKNYGFRNLENQLPVEDSTIFLQASISKTILATAIMQLWEDGLLDLDNNINDYLPNDFNVVNPKQPDALITVRMLMTHTSSLIDNWDIILPLCTVGDSPIPLDTFLVNYFTPGGAYYNQTNFSYNIPGETREYSNTGSCLLALIVEYLSDMSFDEYTKEYVFKPLSMNSTTWFLNKTDTNHLAVQYQYNENLNKIIPFTKLGAPYYPIYQLRTNKLDLSKFQQAYLNGGIYNNNRILDSATVSLMLTDQLGAVNPPGGTQGLIWHNIYAQVSQNSWGHSGSWDGIFTNMIINRVENYKYMYFTNYNRIWTNSFTSFVESIRTMDTQFDNLAMLYGNIYALNDCKLNSRYVDINSDGLRFTASFKNKYSHDFKPSIICKNSSNEVADSIVLVDNGTNGDLLTNDGIYSSYLNPIDYEDFFQIDVSTINYETGKYFITPDRARFTTAGPVKIKSFEISQINELTKLRISNVEIINNSLSMTAPNLRVKFTSPDSCVRNITSAKLFGDLSAQGTKIKTDSYYVDVDTVKDYTFIAEISSNGVVYWRDTIEFIDKNKIYYVPTDFATIQDAIDSASNGNTIIVRDGIYVEDLSVNKSLTIRSENPLGAQIGDSAGVVGSIVIGTTEGISDVTIDGFKLIGQNANGILVGDFVNNLFVTNCKIKNCRISDYDFGISVNSTSTSCLIDSNTIIGVKKRGLSYSGAGVNIVSNNIFQNNGYQGIMVFPYATGTLLIENNNIANNQNGGIVIQADSITIEGNTIELNDFEGILIRENTGGDIIIKENSINNNSWSGILVAENSEANVDSNVVLENNEMGIMVFGSAEISGNYISKNVKEGIGIGLNGTAAIEDNLIQENEVGVKTYNDAGSVSLNKNSISNNSIGILAEYSMILRENIIEDNADIGISVYDSSIDIGQDSDEDAGKNVIRNNINWNIDNNTEGIVSAYRNYWNLTNSDDIDATIFDDNEDNSRGSVNFEPFLVDDPTAIEESIADVPTEYTLKQNYPNPFNPTTTIKYSIPVDLRYEYQDVRLVIYDILGREVATLVNEKQKPGNYEIEFDPSADGLRLTSGIYFYRLRTSEFVDTKKMLLLK